MIRRVLAAVALVTVALTMTAGTAAATPDRAGSEPVAQRGAAISTAAAEPTMWPPAERVAWYNDGVRHNNSADCVRGLLCLDVVDPTRNTYKVFYLRRCTTRALHNFYGTGIPEFINNQTPGTVTRFLDRNGRVLFTSTAYNVGVKIDWTPVWYIDVC